MTERIAMNAGEAIAAVRGATVVDAIVMASAAARGGVVYTSDFDDLSQLRAHFRAVRDHTIYFGAFDPSLHAVDAGGHEKWTFKTGGPVSSSPAVADDGTVFVGSEDKKLYAVALDGTLVWSFATEGPIDSSPAIGPAGEIVVGSRDGSVYCFR